MKSVAVQKIYRVVVRWKKYDKKQDKIKRYDEKNLKYRSGIILHVHLKSTQKT